EGLLRRGRPCQEGQQRQRPESDSGSVHAILREVGERDHGSFIQEAPCLFTDPPANLQAPGLYQKEDCVSCRQIWSFSLELFPRACYGPAARCGNAWASMTSTNAARCSPATVSGNRSYSRTMRRNRTTHANERSTTQRRGSSTNPCFASA